MVENKIISLKELQNKFPAAIDYIVSIFLINREYGKTRNSKLAEHLQVSKSAVNQAIGRLKNHGLVEQDNYSLINLTAAGQEYASAILRKHYLIEYMLIKRMNYPWEKADDEAQRLQSSISDDFTDYLFDFFGQPDTCPHGNPFPGSKVEKELTTAPRIHNAPVGEKIELVRITEEGEAADGLLRFCHMHNLYPGTVIKIMQKINEEMFELENDSLKIHLPLSIAKHLCYRKL